MQGWRHFDRMYVLSLAGGGDATQDIQLLRFREGCRPTFKRLAVQLSGQAPAPVLFFQRIWAYSSVAANVPPADLALPLNGGGSNPVRRTGTSVAGHVGPAVSTVAGMTELCYTPFVAQRGEGIWLRLQLSSSGACDGYFSITGEWAELTDAEAEAIENVR